MSDFCVTVKVPATSANLGPVLDACGMAFSLYNTYQFREIDQDKLIIRGVAKRYQNPNNLVFRAMAEVFKAARIRPKGLIIDNRIDIPFSRGLGSSAACILGGMLGANALLPKPFEEDTILNIATRLEGHPDNILPAYFGGLVHAHYENNTLIHLKNKVHPSLRFFIAIPDFKFSTRQARKVLPEKVSRRDATANIAFATLTTLALIAGNTALLSQCQGDRLHQPYRIPLICDCEAVINLGKTLGACTACLSGSGPSVLFVLESSKAHGFHRIMGEALKKDFPKWHLQALTPDEVGTKVVKNNI